MSTILIVDDHPTNRDFLVTLLSYSGHRLLEAADGAEALVQARAEPPDLAIADILMPTMDGYEFVRQLRADARLAHIPVIFYTAHYHEQEARNLAQACGVPYVLTKPCEPEVILRTVNAALGLGVAPMSPPQQDDFDRDHLRLITDKLSQTATTLRAMNARLDTLIDISLQLASERLPRRLLEHFCHAARNLLGARYATVGIVSDDAHTVRYFFTSGMDEATIARVAPPQPWQGVFGTHLAERSAYRWQQHDSTPLALALPPAYPEIASLLAAGIVSPTRTYGWLCLTDKVGAEAFSAEDERLVAILSAQVGRIYENGSLYRESQAHANQLEQEISDRKQAETELLQVNERFRLATSAVNGVIYEWDVQTDAVQRTQGLAAVLGYQPQDVEATNSWWLACLHPDDQQRVRGQIRTALEQHSTFIAEYRMRHKNGHYVYVWDHGLIVRDAQGRAQRMVGNVLDVTERKQAEEALYQSEQRYRSLIETAREAIFTIAPDGTLTSLSPGFEIITEWPWSEWLGKRFPPLIHPDDVAFTLEMFQRVLHGETIPVFEFRIAKKLGGYATVECTTAPQYEDEHVRCVLGLARDITQRKHLEEQFRQSQKMEAIGQLAGGVAHDFNNMLNVIIGYSELLLSDSDPSHPWYSAVAEIRQAGERAALLTRQLLAFSRRQILTPKVVNLNSVVASLDTLLRRLISENIDLQSILGPALGRVRIDPSQMEQVLMNLAVNARDAMPTGGKLTIETSNVDLDATYAVTYPDVQPGPYVMLAVSDTGCGMDADIRAHIFEPFFTTKEAGKGTGLGLSTVYGIVKQSDGHIWLYSEPGHGTTFKIYLPRIEDTATPSPSSSMVPPPQGGTETVLLVEDEDGVRALASDILRRHGYTVLEAQHGSEALLLSEQYQGVIHLLVTDVVMPMMGGRELADHLTSHRPQMRVLYVSGYTDNTIVHHGVLDPERAFLQKPFTPVDFVRKVRDVLDAPASQEPMPGA